MLLAIDSKMLVPKGCKMKCIFSQVVKSLQRSNVNCQCFNGRIISFLSTHLTDLYQVMTTERVLYRSTESDKLCMSLTRFCFVALITSIEVQSCNTYLQPLLRILQLLNSLSVYLLVAIFKHIKLFGFPTFRFERTW